MDMDKNLLEMMLSRVGDLGFRRRVATLLDYLDIRDGQRVLDLGCGEGFYTMVIGGLYDVEVTAFDFNAEILEKAASWIKDGKRIKFVNGDMSRGLPFENDTFDRVIFTEALEHVEDDLGALNEVRRVLRPGGVVGLTVPNGNYPFLWDPINWTRERLGLGHFSPRNTVLGGVWSYDHKRLYSPQGIRGLAVEAGFRVMKLETLTHYCVPFNYHILRLGKLLSTKLPVPRGMKDSMEKFRWEGERSFGPMKAALNLFRWVDSRNERLNGKETSSVSISLKLEK